jgi:arabinose-5-phosphate isomerase
LKNIENKIQKTAIAAINEESRAVSNLVNSINDDFIATVKLIFGTQGRVVITGIGKSANIATKIVATLNSTGTPSVFMHAADAIHGDIGLVRPGDVVIAISKSGETPEIKVLVPLIKHRKNKLVAMVGNTKSYLAKQADYIWMLRWKKRPVPIIWLLLHLQPRSW